MDPASRNIDFSREERLQRCVSCRAELANLRSVLLEMRNCDGKLGKLINETISDLDVFSTNKA
jgi:hypothetical protein